MHILRVYGTKIEDVKFPELAAIPFLAKRQVAFENEDTDKVPKVLEEHSLHIKIRDKFSKKHEIRKFIKYEDNLKTLKNYEELQEKSDEYFALKKNAENTVLKEAQVIFCTCAEAGSNWLNTRKINQCIIDECAMCIEPETLLPMILSEKIILVGDHKQLQPVVLNKTAESLGLKISMFQRLFKDKNMSRYRIKLIDQYRMVNWALILCWMLLCMLHLLSDTAPWYLWVSIQSVLWEIEGCQRSTGKKVVWKTTTWYMEKAETA